MNSWHIVWKWLKMSHWKFLILAFSTKFCPYKSNLSGNTVWLKASGLQKLAKMDHFWLFKSTFVHSKCKRSSLRSQYWMRLFGRFSNTVPIAEASLMKSVWFSVQDDKCISKRDFSTSVSNSFIYSTCRVTGELPVIRCFLTNFGFRFHFQK